MKTTQHKEEIAKTVWTRDMHTSSKCCFRFSSTNFWRKFRFIIMNPDNTCDGSIFSAKKYVEYQPGKLNVIICIPHGGYLCPPSIPQRDAGCYLNGQCVYTHEAGPKDEKKCPVRYKRDKYTKELGFLVAKELTALTRLKPHIVINHLNRGKLDVNCGMEKGTFGIAEAVDAWKAYHGFIDKAKQDIAGSGLLIDTHGQSHPEGWIELGYTLSQGQLNGKRCAAKDASIYSLAIRSSEEIQKLICGEQSFGGLLASKGYDVIPSPAFLSPGQSHYYTGGYTIQTHGSHNGGLVDAIQLETPKHLRNKEASPKYAKDIAVTIHQYLQLYYETEIRTQAQL